MTDFGGPDRRANTHLESAVSVLSTRLEALHNDVFEIKSAMSSLTSAITKLALVEERQAATNIALERCFVVIAKLEERVGVLEKADAHNKRTNKYVDSVVWSFAAAAIMFIAAKTGLIK